ncbi:MAG: hypothetical protein CMB80_10290 [Flammeovirgaceae bacterium]|nr:hypothetical protein [Flammeovirgaceae bacterium]MBE61346.1 hypothetical protein [Flammeovirgaceae bacterium]MBR10687.1 hypothetical protein [Rickettsiales bacterium]HCX23266.1 hypothetical protein [Cytophagales bacterium]|tara:strand:- start:188 stop:739 length:552 start_codon:yes stop_codon:yes gene_type:complete
MRNIIYVLLALLLHSCGILVKAVQSDYQVAGITNSSFQVIDNELLSETENYVISYAITKRMSALGYQTGQPEPDLLVHYQLYDDSYKIKTLEQPSMGHYLNNMEYTAFNQPAKSQVKRIKGPSLYISIYDSHNNQVLWRGYTPFNGDDEPRLLLATVYQVMNEFHLISDGQLLATNTTTTKGF